MEFSCMLNTSTTSFCPVMRQLGISLDDF